MSIAATLLRSRAVAALTSPHGVDRYLELVNPLWAANEVRARVVSVHRETSGEHPVGTVVLQPTSTWRGHRAGQYVQVGVELPGGRRVTRCFSISSAASMPGEQITLTIRSNAAVRGERSVSRFLVEEAGPGTIVHLGQAEGRFVLDESPATPTNNHLLFITGGSGITPAMSILRTLLRDGYDGRAGRKVTFVHYARSGEDQIFAEELARIAADDNDVTVHLRHDSVFSEFELRRLAPEYERLDTWACGPAPMMALVRESFGDSPRLRTEMFKLGGEASGTAEGQVAFTSSALEAPNTGATLLEQAEAAGLTPEFGCRMGICFSCTARKTSGTVRNVLTGEESDLPDEDVRVCVSTPVGDCAVDL
ncbi:flavin reductase family protein [Nocardioides acrostichi]|uniref:Iron-sulfur cluster-binding domain-containing protein n=1 Tax=Nocardioides acrostichi TaxID=2784339 RepID=A0A930UZC6_9ACTN|nr:iron-sulfur cluster-binding domain-containing protein [Nocardioides acrostichi]MBF4160892.1 iron-sulfur cluster-binding domain-containing protein [Nocardioides acrostichi]